MWEPNPGRAPNPTDLLLPKSLTPLGVVDPNADADGSNNELPNAGASPGPLNPELVACKNKQKARVNELEKTAGYHE